jgi:hypothetical protein
MSGTDWLETSHFKFNAQFTKGISYILTPAFRARAGIGENTPGGDYLKNELAPVMSGYNDLFEKWKGKTYTRNELKDFKESEKKLMKLYRDFYQRFIRTNYLVTNSDLGEMDMPRRPAASRRDPIVVTFSPYVIAEATKEGEVILYFGGRNPETFKLEKGNPPMQRGAFFRYAISKTPLTKPEQLQYTAFDTNSPLVLNLGADVRGEAVYFCACWENTRGERGPFSEVDVIHIP